MHLRHPIVRLAAAATVAVLAVSFLAPVYSSDPRAVPNTAHEAPAHGGQAAAVVGGIGACCRGTEGCACSEPYTATLCANQSGTFFPGLTCAEDPCDCGACCIGGDCDCLEPMTPTDCAEALGTHFSGLSCTEIPCDCNQNSQCDDVEILNDPSLDCDGSGVLDVCEPIPCPACCDPTGNCIGDMPPGVCEGMGANYTAHPNARCTQPNEHNAPPPVCNVTDCFWDNGLWLDDGGASRAHVHAGGFGQPGRYNFATADDFILPDGPEEYCSIHVVRVWMRFRPLFFPPQPPTPEFDITTGDPNYNRGWNVTIYAHDAVNSKPGGTPVTPSSAGDVNAQQVDIPGGIVYTRHFRMAGPGAAADAGLVSMCQLGPDPTFDPGLCDDQPVAMCDPGVKGDFEDPFVYQVDITIPGGVLLKNNVRYWLAVQSVFPFNDKLRNSLQTWWMMSENNTGNRAQAFRTGVAQFSDWIPNGNGVGGSYSDAFNGNLDSCPPATPPLGTHFDFAFQLFGEAALSVPNDACADAAQVFDGVTPFDTASATTDGGTDGCTASGPHTDLWFTYEATCTGAITVNTCGSLFDTALTIYDGTTCSPLGTELVCNDDTTDCDPSSGTGESSVKIAVSQGTQYLIRVGGKTAADRGDGLLTITCEEPCGREEAADCCQPVGPPYDKIGCTNPYCCEIVCGQMPSCCDLIAGSWNDQCAALAAQELICHCPCELPCPAGSVAECEACRMNPFSDPDCNYGCDKSTPLWQTIECGQTICGTLSADGGDHDTDWFLLEVADTNGDGTDSLIVNFNANLPIAVSVIDYALCRQGDDDCRRYDAVCITPDAAPAPQGCPDCQCDLGCARPDRWITLERAGTASCAGNKTIAGDDQTISTCLPPGRYSILVEPAEPDPNLPDDPDAFVEIDDGFLCGLNHRDYTFSVSCGASCITGSCCTCSGGCVDGITEEQCRQQSGSGFVEGGTCPNGACGAVAHGCISAIDLGVVSSSTVVVDLTSQDERPSADINREIYSCGGSGAERGTAWYRFAVPAGVTACEINTCYSTGTGRDSVFALYEGDCCDSGPLTLREYVDSMGEAACSDDDCGFTGDLGSALIEGLTGGEEFWIQISNWDWTFNGEYELRINCPPRGGCCDPIGVICEDDVRRDECLFPAMFSLTRCDLWEIPCGFGACCAADTSCSDTILADCPEPSVHMLNTTCQKIYFCQVSDSCNYDSGILDFLAADVGFISQYVPSEGVFDEMADDFEMSGTGGNDCLIQTIELLTFHTAHDQAGGCQIGGSVACSDTAEDYEGVHVTISEDTPNEMGSGPSCVPTTQPAVDGTHTCADTRISDPNATSHPPISVAFSGDPTGTDSQLVDAGDPPPDSGDWWEYAVELGRRTSVLDGTFYHITLHFDPPIRLLKNQRYWLAITVQMETSAKYRVAWFLSVSYNGIDLQKFNTTDEHFETTPFSCTSYGCRDMLFKLSGAKGPPPPCGPCQLHGDVFPFDSGDPDGNPVGNCIVDIDDLLTVLASFSAADHCTGFPNGVNTFPCNELCTAGTVDIDDILAALSAFSGSFGCPHPCPGGACCFGDSTCQDWDGIGAGTTPTGGMSETTCTIAGGSYQGDGTTCDAVTCP